MSKTVRKVFLIVGTLVLVFLIWQLVFNPNGIVKTAYNAFATGINGQWQKAAGGGDNAKLIPTWNDSNADKGANGKGFDIDTGNKAAGTGDTK